MKIEKKTWPEYFEMLLNGKKTFDIRLADFKCKPGDVLVLREWNPKTKSYSGRSLEKKINYVLKTKDIQFWPNEDAKKYGFYVIGWEEKGIKQIQDEVRNFCRQTKMESPIEHRMLDLTSEVGEVAKEILKMSDYGRKEAKYNEWMEYEVGDAFYSLITVANYFNIDLEKALAKSIKKYKNRLVKKSSR